MAKLKLDLHDIFNKGNLIDKALTDVINDAVKKKVDTVEIIPGKGTGQLKKKVIRFLNEPNIKNLYKRYKVDNINFGKIYVYF
ncbi:MAG: Smr/MutS family protein [Elusimicrobia bacterium]|nr:Smr/MutS family protein [Elusimicrobiota bacterium]